MPRGRKPKISRETFQALEAFEFEQKAKKARLHGSLICESCKEDMHKPPEGVSGKRKFQDMYPVVEGVTAKHVVKKRRMPVVLSNEQIARIARNKQRAEDIKLWKHFDDLEKRARTARNKQRAEDIKLYREIDNLEKLEKLKKKYY